jgi:hypothetical protein
MALRNTDPDPLDRNDPRVAVEWTDMCGQTVRPRDLVAVGGYRQTVGVAMVVSINLLRKNGTPFSHGGPTMTLQSLTKDVTADEWIPKRRSGSRYEKNESEDEDYPCTYTLRNPTTGAVKITLPNFKDRPYVP